MPVRGAEMAGRRLVRVPRFLRGVTGAPRWLGGVWEGCQDF